MSNQEKTFFQKAFVEAEKVTPAHVLFEQYADLCKLPKDTMYKMGFYVMIQDNFGDLQEKADNGDLGYKLKLVKTI